MMSMTDAGFMCASREHSPAGARAFPGPDEWRSLPNGDRVCSFCGSLHPDDFLRCVEEAAKPDGGAEVSRATGKDYKIYARRADVRNAGEGGIKFYTWHLPNEAFTDRVNAVYPKAVEESARRMRAKFGHE